MPGVAINDMRGSWKVSRSTTGSSQVEVYKIDRQSKLRICKMGLYIDWSRRYVQEMLDGRAHMYQVKLLGSTTVSLYCELWLTKM